MQFPLLNPSKFSFLPLWLKGLAHIKVREHVQTSPIPWSFSDLNILITAGGRPMMTTPDLRCAARFDVENNVFDVFSNFRMRPEADIVQLNALDSKLATGLKPKEFWALFSKCARCNLFVTSRSMEYHKANQCQNDGALKISWKNLMRAQFSNLMNNGRVFIVGPWRWSCITYLKRVVPSAIGQHMAWSPCYRHCRGTPKCFWKAFRSLS